ncbi:unnamed protein product [Gongylonema pulchrum]|uniref:Uncharacterized protein n=1 Tax=Gongylonema pulchrum TaxID=637853 RepID=A0A3P6T4C0_9BILA|nr:unnamed protein product [Gongylonema pulchrum]
MDLESELHNIEQGYNQFQNIPAFAEDSWPSNDIFAGVQPTAAALHSVSSGTAVEESAGTQKGATGAAADSGPNESSGTSGPSKDSIDDATLEQVVKRGIMTEYVDKRRRREKPDEVIIRELMQSIKDTVAARTDHGAGKRAFMDNYYQNLAIDWHGSPELQWRGQCWQRKCSLSLIFIWQ